MTPQSAMVFAAGFGTRLGPLVEHQPKPLIKVAGKPLIDHALDIVEDAGVARCAVNLHYRSSQLENHLRGRRNLTLLTESPDLLDTGGGLLNAVSVVGKGPVFTLNADTVWSGPNPLLKLAQAWKPDSMEALLLLVPTECAIGHQGGSDFVRTEERRLRRAAEGELGFVYTGAQIIDTRCLPATGERVFSLNVVWNRLMNKGTLAGTVYKGVIGDAGNPSGLRASMRISRQPEARRSV